MLRAILHLGASLWEQTCLSNIYFLIFSCTGSSRLCVGFLSVLRLLLVRSMGSAAQAQQLGAQAQLLPRIRGLPGPAIEPISPALAGGL